MTAVQRYALTPDPLGLAGREHLLDKALARAAIKAQTHRERLCPLQPPMEELLP